MLELLSKRALTDYDIWYWCRVQPRPSNLRSEEGQDEKKTDTLNTESNQDGSVESSGVGANDTSVSSLCNGIISHSEDPECGKESSLSSMSASVPVSEEGKEVDARVDTVDSESNPSIDMEHDSGTDHQEEAANGKEDPAAENLAVDSSCSDITTLSPSAATVFIPQENEHSDSESKPLEKEHSDTEMIDAQ